MTELLYIEREQSDAGCHQLSKGQGVAPISCWPLPTEDTHQMTISAK